MCCESHDTLLKQLDALAIIFQSAAYAYYGLSAALDFLLLCKVYLVADRDLWAAERLDVFQLFVVLRQFAGDHQLYLHELSVLLVLRAGAAAALVLSPSFLPRSAWRRTRLVCRSVHRRVPSLPLLLSLSYNWLLFYRDFSWQRYHFHGCFFLIGSFLYLQLVFFFDWLRNAYRHYFLFR